jgi:hypothetical protein
MNEILQTIIRFPEIQLNTRDAHKLRGFFGDYFKLHSPLLHNHYEDGTLRYQYPLIQYKVIGKTPTLVALNDGAELLSSLFLKINQIRLEDRTYPISSKNIEQRKIPAGIGESLNEYRFDTLWMALNQQNYKEYINLNAEEKADKLNQVLRNNILSFYKGAGIWLDSKIMTKGKFTEKETRFKDKKMLAFGGSFITNALLPPGIGLGKSVSRGFGSISLS